jgi:hypothetical protein
VTDPQLLRQRLKQCPSGRAGSKEYEDTCIEILKFLFVPPLNPPVIQPRSYSGIDRRDAVFPNRIMNEKDNWGFLYRELAARLIFFESRIQVASA